FMKHRQYKKDQMENLSGSSVSQQEVVTAQLAAEAAQFKDAQAKAAAQRLADELTATRAGQVIGASDGRNDVPYSQQPIHHVGIRQQDLTARIQEYAARCTQLRKQVQIEGERMPR